MADNFFDGTLGDFFDEHDLFDLANLELPLPPLPLPLPTPSLSFRPSPFGLLPFEPPAFPHFGSRRAAGDRPSLFGNNTTNAEARSALSALRPGPHGNRPSLRPTQPTAADRPISAVRGLERSRNQTPASAINSLPHPIPPPFQLNSRSFLGASRPNIRTSTHQSPNTSNLPNPFTTTTAPRDCSSTSTRPQRPPQDLNTGITTGTPSSSRQSGSRFNFAAAFGLPTQPLGQRETPTSGGNNGSLESPPGVRPLSSTMSSSRSRGGVRLGDLAMPSASHSSPIIISTGPISRAPRRPSRSSVSQLSEQPQKNEHLFATKKRKREDDKDDDDKKKFGDDAFSDHEVVDLVDKDELPVDMLSQKTNNFVKVSTLTCIICMDSCKNLTVTYCGHLYCSECLQAAFNMDTTKRICPFCRQKIDKMPPAGKYAPKNKGYYALELKLMTKKTLGKKPAQT